MVRAVGAVVALNALVRYDLYLLVHTFLVSDLQS